jgi:hypothetical protein
MVLLLLLLLLLFLLLLSWLLLVILTTGRGAYPILIGKRLEYNPGHDRLDPTR